MQSIIFTASFIRPSDDTIKFDRYFSKYFDVIKLKVLSNTKITCGSP